MTIIAIPEILPGFMPYGERIYRLPPVLRRQVRVPPHHPMVAVSHDIHESVIVGPCHLLMTGEGVLPIQLHIAMEEFFHSVDFFFHPSRPLSLFLLPLRFLLFEVAPNLPHQPIGEFLIFFEKHPVQPLLQFRVNNCVDPCFLRHPLIPPFSIIHMNI
jgi:hypothetical protein